MQHLFIFMYVLVILTGTASIAIAGLIYARTRTRLLAEYILYISNLLFFIFVYPLLLLYFHLNVADVNFYILLSTVTLALLSGFLLMYTIPRFAHALVWDKPQPRRNRCAAILAIVAFVLMVCSFRANLSERTLSQERNTWMYTSLVLFYVPVVYSIVLEVSSLRRFIGERRRIVGGIALLNMVFFPGVIADLFLYVRFGVFVFSPVFYCVFCILFTQYVVRQYSAQLQSLSSELNEASIDCVLGRAGISSREKEIILLLSKGLGNREIAERLFISLNTVKTHNRNIFQKLGVTSRFELLVKLRQNAGEHPTSRESHKG